MTTPAPEVARALGKKIPLSTSHAVVLTGIRRCGKSTLLAQILNRAQPAAFITFEDTRLFQLEVQDFSTLLSALDEVCPANAAVGLDEVQELSEWQRLVRALLDRGRTVYVTGSNASLLGRELGVRLSGRHLSFEVHPFSYSEYLDYTRQPVSEASFRAYLDDGGFPEYLRERNDHILHELVRDVIRRDIASRYGLRELRHLMNLALFLLANTGQAFSLQRLTKSLAVPTVGQTARYVEYLQDAYLLMALPKFGPAFRKRVVSPRKYYAVDNGLRRANSPQAAPDVDHRLENVVYLALQEKHPDVTYAGERDLWECDFIAGDAAIQVCAELTESNKAHELAGLLHAVQLCGSRRAMVLTLHQTDRFAVEGFNVHVVPVWRWLCESE